MNYYIQGNKEKADQIKAAFEKLGIASNADRYNYKNDNVLYFTAGGMIHMIDANGAWANIIKTHPDYKELELPVNPSFKVGDWIASIDGEGDVTVERIVNLRGNKVLLVDTDGCFVEYPKGELESCHLWSIADAKEGDVLAIDWHEDGDSWEKIVIFKKYHNKGVKGLINRSCVEGYGNTFKNGKLAFNEEVPYYSKTWTYTLQPATAKQRDLLFQKMKENGYEWDFEKKELKKIQPHYDIANFKPFDKVLVRDTKYGNWNVNLFSYYIDDIDARIVARFRCINSTWIQCIPFNEETKHLLGTTDMCDEQYVNW